MLKENKTYQQRLVERGLTFILLHGAFAVRADVQRQLKGAGRFGRLDCAIRTESSHVLEDAVLALTATQQATVTCGVGGPLVHPESERSLSKRQ